MEKTKKVALISRCLCNELCRYDGKIVENSIYKKLNELFTLIKVCPEVDGGLNVPRDPCEIQVADNKKLYLYDNFTKQNFDIVTQDGSSKLYFYKRGCLLARKLAIETNASYAFLKEKSPSCGVKYIYDGSFKRKLVDQNGLLVEYLKDLNITIVSSDDLEKFISKNFE